MGWETPVLALYGALLAVLSVYGLHRAWLVGLYRWFRRPRRVEPVGEWPAVTVQLPVFNERFVVERLVAACGELDYPRDRLEIQVLDDSTDDTTEMARAAVERLRERGIDASWVHRTDRTGFKAGALQEGTQVAKGELLAVFDADFVPRPDFLRQVVPWMVDGIGMVQARWGHLNAAQSWLTRIQATLLDGHFVVEHTARHRSGSWFNFNGTAGVWRRQAIEDAGGWQHDTLTEDLDLSYRAQLAGWRFVYLDDVVAPAELPGTMAAFKSQQHRWAKGSVQTARKLLPAIWTGRASLRVKLEATLHLVANFAYPLVLLLAVLMPLAIAARGKPGLTPLLAVDLLFFACATLSVLVFYGVSVRDSGAGTLWRRLIELPLVLSLGLGMSVSQSRAVLEGLVGEVGVFVRTPKQGGKGRGYRARVHWMVWVEVALAAYLWSAVLGCLYAGLYASIPFLLLFALGFTWTGGGSLVDGLAPRRLQTA